MSKLTPGESIFYSFPVEPPNTNNNQNPTNHKQNTAQRDTVALIIMIYLTIFMFLLFIGECVFLSYHNITKKDVPNFNVDNLALSQFLLSPSNNNTLYYNLTANMTFGNRYNYMGIYFDKIDASLMYQGQRLGTKTIPDVFYLGSKKEKSIVNVAIIGEQMLQLINDDEKLVYASQNRVGVYKIGLKVKMMLRCKAMLRTYRYGYEFICDNLEVSLNSGVKVTTNCFYKELSNKSFDVKD